MPTSNAISRRRSRDQSHVTSTDRVSAAMARAQARRDRESSKSEEIDSIDVDASHEQKLGKSLQRVEQRKNSKSHRSSAKLKLNISSIKEDNDTQKIDSYNGISSPRSPLVPKSQASSMSMESLSKLPQSSAVSPEHQNIPIDDRNPASPSNSSIFDVYASRVTTATELTVPNFSSVNQENHYSPSNHLLSSTNKHSSKFDDSVSSTMNVKIDANLESNSNDSQHDCKKVKRNIKAENSINILETSYSDLSTNRDPPDDTPKEDHPVSTVSSLEQSLRSTTPNKLIDMNTELSAFREIMKKNEETIKTHCTSDNTSLHIEASTDRINTVTRDVIEAMKSSISFDWQLEDVASKKTGAGWKSHEPVGKNETYDDNSFRFDSVHSDDSIDTGSVDVERLVKAFLSMSSDSEASIPVPSIYKTKDCVVDTTEKHIKSKNGRDVIDTIYEGCSSPSEIVEKKENDEKIEKSKGSTMDSMLYITKSKDSVEESENDVNMSQNETSLTITNTSDHKVNEVGKGNSKEIFAVTTINREDSMKSDVEKEAADSTIENTVNVSSSLKTKELSDLCKANNTIETTQDVDSAVTHKMSDLNGSNLKANNEISLENMMSGKEKQIGISSAEDCGVETSSVTTRTNKTGDLSIEEFDHTNKINEPSIEEFDTEISSADLAIYFGTFKRVIADLREADGVLSVKGHQLDQLVEMSTPLFGETQTIERLEEEIRAKAPSVRLPKHLVEAIIDMSFHQEVNGASDDNNLGAIMRSNTMTVVDIADGSDEIEVDYSVGLLAMESVNTNNIPPENESIDVTRSNEIPSPTEVEIDNQDTDMKENNSTFDICADACESHNLRKDNESLFSQASDEGSSPWSNGDSARLKDFMDFAFPLITTGLTSTVDKQKLLDEAKRRSIPVKLVEHLLEMQIEMEEGQQLTENLSDEIRSIASEELALKFQKQHFDEIENIDESDRISSYISRLNEMKLDQSVHLHSPDFVKKTSQEGEGEVCNQDIREPFISVGSKEGQGSNILELGTSNDTTEANLNEEPAPERQKQHFDEIENLDESDTVSSYISRLDEVRIDQPLNLLHSPNFVENTSQEEGEVEVCNQDIREPLISVGMKEGQGSDILELGTSNDATEANLNEETATERQNQLSEMKSNVKILNEKEGENCLPEGVQNMKATQQENELENGAATREETEEKLGSREGNASVEKDRTEDTTINCVPVLVDEGLKVEITSNKLNISEVEIISQELGDEKIICGRNTDDDDDDDDKVFKDKYDFHEPDVTKSYDNDETENDRYEPMAPEIQINNIEKVNDKYEDINENEKIRDCMNVTKVDAIIMSEKYFRSANHLEEDDWQNASHSTAEEHHGYEPFLREGSQTQSSDLEVDNVTGVKNGTQEGIDIIGEGSGSYYSFDSNHHLLLTDSSKQLSENADTVAMSALDSSRLISEPVQVQSNSEDELDMDSERYKVRESKSEECRRKHEILNMLKLKHMNRNPASNHRSSENSLNHQSSRRKHLGFTFHRGVHMCNHWKKSYKERTKCHPGYLNADIYSLYESSHLRHHAHEFDEVPWENRNVKQRFLHEQSYSMSRNWFGDLLKKRGNDRVRQAVSHPLSMRMPMDQNSRPEEWTEEWFATWKPRWEASPSVSTGSSRDDSSFESDDDYDDDDRKRGGLSRRGSRSARDSAKGPLESDFSTDQYSLQSTFESSSIVDDDEMSWEEEIPECGTLINVKPKIDERVSRIHPEFTSSLRRSKWRRKYFPRGTFPY